MSYCRSRSIQRRIPIVLSILLLPAVLPGQTYPEIQWWFDLDAPSFGSAAVDDIDGDGLPEIVFGTYFNDESFHALNAENGTELWSFFTDGCNDASPVIADVDLDGELEVIAAASSPYHLYCLDGATGIIEWSTSTGYPNCIDSPPAVADVDGDGKPEVVLGTFNGYVFCFNGENGSIAWQCSLGTDSAIQTCPNILDVDCDGDLDVVVAQWNGDNRIYALEGIDGSILWFSDLPGDYIYHGGSFADVDADGKPEIVIGSYDHYIYLLNAEDGSLEWSYYAPYYVAAPTSIADVDADNDLEIVYTSNNRIGVLDHNGDPVWSYTAGGSMFRGAALANIDGDTITDIIFGDTSGMLTALRGTSPDIIWEIDLEAHYGNTFNIDNAPVIADFDGDGKLDVFVVGGYATSSTPENNHGRAYMLSAGEGSGPGWPMFRHDIRRSGCLEGSGTGIEEANLLPSLIELNCYPNPFASVTRMTFHLTAACHVSSEVFDLAGRMVKGVIDQELQAGPHLVNLDLSDLPCGVYIVRLRVGTASSARQIVKLD